jgi:hypothetical protein
MQREIDVLTFEINLHGLNTRDEFKIIQRSSVEELRKWITPLGRPPVNLAHPEQYFQKFIESNQ